MNEESAPLNEFVGTIMVSLQKCDFVFVMIHDSCFMVWMIFKIQIVFFQIDFIAETWMS